MRNLREVLTDLVLISIHAGESPNVREDILQRISKLEGIHVAQTELNMCVDN